MPKPRRIQKLNDMGAKALADFEEAQARLADDRYRRAEREVEHVVDDLRRVADRKDWSIIEKKEQLDGHV